MLFALGLDDKIVGVTSYCNYPPEALAKEKVGDTLRPSIEKIVALKPDVVVASTASQLEQFVQKLESIGIPVYVSNPRNVDEVLVSVQKLADLMNVKERGDDVVRQMRSRIDSLEARLAGASRPRVLLVLGSSPLITAGGGTFLDDLVTRAGGRSVSAQVTGDYPQFSLETAAASDPEVILMQSGESQPPSRLSQTSAVRNGRVCHIDDDVLLRPGPRVVLAIEQLFSCIHPELK
jgi:iron complex transport system substrate-binding protein